MKYKVGVVGAGRIAAGFDSLGDELVLTHAHAVKREPRLELVGFWDLNNQASLDAAAKWGVIGLTKSLAIELGPYGCRSNAICPGSVKGDRINRVIQGEADVRGVPFDVVAKEIVNNQSLERLTEADEVAALAVYLASPAAFMINGQDIAIDGHVETFHIK